MQGEPTAEAELKRLNFLIGKWTSKGDILTEPNEAPGKIIGSDTYEWVAGGIYVLHRVNVLMDEEKVEVIELIGYDVSRQIYTMHSFDNKGNNMIMHATIEDEGVMKIFSDKMRSTLTAGKEGNRMTAKWERSKDGTSWQPWLEMHFTRNT